jgi:RHS repeat-associated protein
LTLALNHQTTDIGMALPGSELSLSVGRTLTGEMQSDVLGGSPSFVGADLNVWQMEHPFGPCWKSGVTAYIRWTVRETPAQSTQRPAPIYTEVVDENGSVHRFLPVLDKQYFVANPALLTNRAEQMAHTIYVPVPGNVTEQDALSMQLSCALEGAQPVYTFTRKYGTKLTFKVPTGGALQTSYVSNQWEEGHGSNGDPPALNVTNYYIRLVEVEDKLGYKLIYDYGNRDTLIPVTITSRTPGNQEQTLTILTLTETTTSPDRFQISKIVDSAGNAVEYTWSSLTFDTTLANDLITQATVPYISSVTRGIRTTVVPGIVEARATVAYEIDAYREADFTPQDIQTTVGSATPQKPAGSFHHFNLLSITNADGGKYSFRYGQDVGKLHYQKFQNTDYPGYYTPSGLARIVTRTETPSGTASFQQVGDPVSLRTKMVPMVNADGTNHATIKVSVPDVLGRRALKVTAADRGQRMYQFVEPEVVAAEQFKDLLIGPDNKVQSFPFLIMWKGMVLTHPNNKTESFTFDPHAGYALTKVRDYSGNITTYEYEDSVYPEAGAVPLGANLPNNLINLLKAAKYPLLTGRHGDPTRQTNPLMGVKTFAYDRVATLTRPASHLMLESVDEIGTKTITELDALDRRKNELVKDPEGKLLKKTEFVYGNASYPGVVTEEKVFDFTATASSVKIHTLSILDANGYVKQKSVGDGASYFVTYMKNDAWGNVTSSTDGRATDAETDTAYTTTFSYDSQGRVLSTRFPAADVLNYGQTAPTRKAGSLTTVYSPGGRTLSSQDEGGIWTYFTYDDSGRVISTRRSMAGSPGAVTADIITSTTYNCFGQVLTSTDALGRTSISQYDVMGRLTATTDAMGNRNSFVYDPGTAQHVGGSAFDSSSFKVTYKYDPLGYVTRFTYDALYRLTKTEVQYELVSGAKPWTIPDSKFASTSTAYDAVGNAVLVTDPVGIQTVTYYDYLHRPVDAYTGLKDVRPSAVIDKFGVPTWVRPRDATYRAHKEYHPSGGVSLEEVHWRTASTPTQTGGEMRVRQTRSIFDSAGRVLALIQGADGSGLAEVPPTDATAASSSNCLSTISAYDAAGNLTSVTVNKGVKQVTRNFYDERNRLVATSSNPTGTPGTTPAAGDIVVRKFYDSAGRVSRVVDPIGAISETQYDHANRPVLTAQRGLSTATPGYSYLDLNPVSPATVSTPLISRTEYDAAGQVVLVTDPNGSATFNTYDLLGRLITTKTNPAVQASMAAHPADILVRNTYDQVGNLVAVTDGQYQLTYYSYDGLHRKLSETAGAHLPATDSDSGDYPVVQNTTSFTYNGALLVSKTKPDGRKISFTYDAWQRVKTISYPKDGTTLNPQDRSYTYDANGDLRAVTYPNETTAERKNVKAVFYDYDCLGRMISETSAGTTHHYRYDLANNRILATYGNTGSSIVTAYDLLNRVTTIKEYTGTTTGTPVATTTYVHDKLGHITSLLQPNGVTTTSIYDTLGRLTSATTANVQTITYAYDAVGSVRRLSEDNRLGGVSDRVVENTYDRTYRLTKEVVTSIAPARTVTTLYAYDKGNNRISKQMLGSFSEESRRYVFNGHNQLQKLWDGSGGLIAAYDYDYNGNRMFTASDTGDARQVYLWDDDNRLVFCHIAGQTLPPGDNHLQPTIPRPEEGTWKYTYDYRTRRVQVLQTPNSLTTYSFSGGTSVHQKADGIGSEPTPLIRIVRPRHLHDEHFDYAHNLFALSSLLDERSRWDADADGDGTPNLVEQVFGQYRWYDEYSHQFDLAWKNGNPASPGPSFPKYTWVPSTPTQGEHWKMSADEQIDHLLGDFSWWTESEHKSKLPSEWQYWEHSATWRATLTGNLNLPLPSPIARNLPSFTRTSYDAAWNSATPLNALFGFRREKGEWSGLAQRGVYGAGGFDNDYPFVWSASLKYSKVVWNSKVWASYLCLAAPRISSFVAPNAAAQLLDESYPLVFRPSSDLDRDGTANGQDLDSVAPSGYSLLSRTRAMPNISNATPALPSAQDYREFVYSQLHLAFCAALWGDGGNRFNHQNQDITRFEQFLSDNGGIPSAEVFLAFFTQALPLADGGPSLSDAEFLAQVYAAYPQNPAGNAELPLPRPAMPLENWDDAMSQGTPVDNAHKYLNYKKKHSNEGWPPQHYARWALVHILLQMGEIADPGAYASAPTSTIEGSTSDFLPYTIKEGTQRIARLSQLSPAWARPMGDLDGDGLPNVWEAQFMVGGTKGVASPTVEPTALPVALTMGAWLAARTDPATPPVGWGPYRQLPTGTWNHAGTGFEYELNRDTWMANLMPAMIDKTEYKANFALKGWYESNCSPLRLRDTDAPLINFGWQGASLPAGWGRVWTDSTNGLVKYQRPPGASPVASPMPVRMASLADRALSLAAVGRAYTPPAWDDFPLIFRPDADVDGNGVANLAQFLKANPTATDVWFPEARTAAFKAAVANLDMTRYTHWVGEQIQAVFLATRARGTNIYGQVPWSEELCRQQIFFHYDRMRANGVFLDVDVNGEVASATGAAWDPDIALWISLAGQPTGYPTGSNYPTVFNTESQFPRAMWPLEDWDGDGVSNQDAFNAYRSAHSNVYTRSWVVSDPALEGATTTVPTLEPTHTATWEPVNYWQWAVAHILLQKGQFGAAKPNPQLAASGAVTVKEQPVVAAVAGSVAVEYVRGSDMGGGVGGLLYSKRWVNGAWVRSYDLANGRGDVTTQTNQAGAVTWQASYEAFGMRTAEAGTNLDPQRGNTKDEDPTGLSNQGHRYLDLETGVWLSRDPAGFVDGPNLYTYVRQNPWTKFDPNGLDDRTAAGVLPTRDKHHIIPVASWDHNNLSHDVQKRLDKVRIGKPDVKHGYAGHGQYNARVTGIVAEFVESEGIDPSKLTGRAADDYADKLEKYVKNSGDDYVKEFNKMVHSGASQEDLKKFGKIYKAEVKSGTKIGGFWVKKNGIMLNGGKFVSSLADAADGLPSAAKGRFFASAGKAAKIGMAVGGFLLSVGCAASEAEEDAEDGATRSEILSNAVERAISFDGQTPEERLASRNAGSQCFFNWIGFGSGKWETDAEAELRTRQESIK